MQELQQLEYEIYRDKKDRRIDKIKWAFQNYIAALDYQAEQARQKRSWWSQIRRWPWVK